MLLLMLLLIALLAHLLNHTYCFALNENEPASACKRTVPSNTVVHTLLIKNYLPLGAAVLLYPATR